MVYERDTLCVIVNTSVKFCKNLTVSKKVMERTRKRDRMTEGKTDGRKDGKTDGRMRANL